MQNISEGNKSYILHKGLTALHKESLSWLSNIEFWKFELSFFQNLVDKNFLRVTLPDKMQQLEVLEKQISNFRYTEIEQLELEIKKHEHYLNKLESGDSDADDVTYRQHHLNEFEKMNQSTIKLREIKKALFQFIEHVIDLD